MADIKLVSDSSRPAPSPPKPQFAVVFPVKRPAQYRWLFAGRGGQWFEVGARIELSPPPNATGIEWRNPEPSGCV